MIIAIDLDDVLAKSLPSFIDFHNRNYKTNLKIDDFKKFFLAEIIALSREEEMKRVELFDESRDFDEIPPMEGAQEAVSKLGKTHELVIVTSRPQKQERRTLDWVKKNFPEIRKVLFIRQEYSGHSKTKAEVCTEIGAEVLIEDKPDYAEQCVEKGIKVLLFDYPYNRSTEHKNITRVKSWKEVERVLDNSK